MGRRRTKRKRALWKKILLVLVLAWFVLEGRFYFPKWIRPPEGVQPVEVEMQTTSYCHCRKCCSYKWFLFIPYQKTDFMKYRFKHVGKTSSGAMVRPGSIAADTSIYPYGTVMYIPGYGYGRVEDTGGAIKGRHIDLYRPNHWFAHQWGVRKKKVKVWLPAKGQAWSFNPAKEQTGITTALPIEEVAVEFDPQAKDVATSATPPSTGPVSTNETTPEMDAVSTNGPTAFKDVNSTNESTSQIPLP